MDEPLLGICDDDALTFVCVVDDDEEPTPAAEDDGDEDSSSEGMLSESERSFSDIDQSSSLEEELDGWIESHPPFHPL